MEAGDPNDDIRTDVTRRGDERGTSSRCWGRTDSWCVCRPRGDGRGAVDWTRIEARWEKCRTDRLVESRPRGCGEETLSFPVLHGSMAAIFA